MKIFNFLILGLLLLAGTAHAQGNCPPGYYEIGGQGTSGCAPLPGYDVSDAQQALPKRSPPQIWVDHYGAIATDSVKSVLGVAVNQTSQSQAEQVAFADCQSRGGTSCHHDIWYVNQCVAMVVGKTGYNTKAGATINDAVQAATKVCSAATGNCHAYYTACSLPVRIQ